MTYTSAKIIADSISPLSISPLLQTRITSIEVEFPRFILPEINTHRLISKSVASSRAIPLEKRVEDCINRPFIPSNFGKNQPGMQSTLSLSEEEQLEATRIWLQARDAAVQQALKLGELKVHKQQANRLLEPFIYCKAILTATAWQNFIELRTHKDAQPEFQELANLIKNLLETSTPSETAHHLPYVSQTEISNYTYRHKLDFHILCKLSAARCARTSYKLHDGAPATVEKDLELSKKLRESGHMSPFDHPAILEGDWTQTRQYTEWIPYRSSIESLKNK